MIMPFANKTPVIDESCFIADNASIIGDVTIGKDSSVWFGAVIRGDAEKIIIGEKSNIQDNTVIHCDPRYKTVIGNSVTIGHSAIIHSAEIGDNVLIGMGAIVMNKAKIGKNSIIGAGALVTESTVIPENSVAFGSPAKVVKKTTPVQNLMNKTNASSYVGEGKKYKKIK